MVQFIVGIQYCFRIKKLIIYMYVLIQKKMYVLEKVSFFCFNLNIFLFNIIYLMGQVIVIVYFSFSLFFGFVYILIYFCFVSGNISYRNYFIKKVMIVVLLIMIYKF